MKRYFRPSFNFEDKVSQNFWNKTLFCVLFYFIGKILQRIIYWKQVVLSVYSVVNRTKSFASFWELYVCMYFIKISLVRVLLWMRNIDCMNVNIKCIYNSMSKPRRWNEMKWVYISSWVKWITFLNEKRLHVTHNVQLQTMI